MIKKIKDNFWGLIFISFLFLGVASEVGAKTESPPPICYAGQTCYNWMESGSSTYLVSPSDCKLKRIAPNAFYIECE